MGITDTTVLTHTLLIIDSGTRNAADVFEIAFVAIACVIAFAVGWLMWVGVPVRGRG